MNLSRQARQHSPKKKFMETKFMNLSRQARQHSPCVCVPVCVCVCVCEGGGVELERERARGAGVLHAHKLSHTNVDACAGVCAGYWRTCDMRRRIHVQECVLVTGAHAY
jgi:hypothetical protein